MLPRHQAGWRSPSHPWWPWSRPVRSPPFRQAPSMPSCHRRVCSDRYASAPERRTGTGSDRGPRPLGLQASAFSEGLRDFWASRDTRTQPWSLPANTQRVSLSSIGDSRLERSLRVRLFVAVTRVVTAGNVARSKALRNTVFNACVFIRLCRAALRGCYVTQECYTGQVPTDLSVNGFFIIIYGAVWWINKYPIIL